MSVADNRDRGFDVEDAACERWPLEVADPDARNGWYDLEFVADCRTDRFDELVATTGTKVEAKSCYAQYDDRAGRWWIRRQTHDRLVDANGEYVLAVLDRDSETIQRMALVTARTVDALIDGEWWDAGAGGQDTDQFRQIPWKTVFRGLDAPGGEST